MERVRSNVLRLDNLFRMAVLWSLAVILSYLKLLFRKVCRSAVVTFPRSPPENSPVTGLACIVTGASSGIGKATAEALALHGYHVILAGRSMNRLLEVISELKKKHDTISLDALELDLLSVESVLSFEKAVRTLLQDTQDKRELQLLVNNAGILAGSQRWTVDGFDSIIATNYLGPYVLTQQLLPILKRSPNARVVNVVSFTHRCVKALTVDEEQLAQGSMQSPSSKGKWYKLAEIYETSKLSLLLFTYELHCRFAMVSDSSKLTVMAADPGIVQTNIMRELPGWLEWQAHFFLRLLGLLQSPAAGAKAVIDAALAPKGVSGKYFFGGEGRILESSFLSYDSALSMQLWETSSSLCDRAILSSQGRSNQNAAYLH